MALPYLVTSGEVAKEADSENWETVLTVAPGQTINWITLVNEGDESGMWRLVQEGMTVEGDGTLNATPPARLPAGGGEAGSRRAAINIACESFNGRLEVKASGIGQRLTGIFAFGMK